jgi:hypothetical protein
LGAPPLFACHQEAKDEHDTRRHLQPTERESPSKSAMTRPSSLDKPQPVAIMRDSKMSSHRRSLEKIFVMEDDGRDAVEGEEPKKKRFFCWWLSKGHWLAAIVGSVLLVLAIVLLVLFLAIVPSIFQKNVDNVHLRINYMDIKSMTSDGTSNKMDVELNMRVEANATVSSAMDATQVMLYYKDKPFSAVTLPVQKLNGGVNAFDLVLRNDAEITDAAVFRALSKALITETNVSVDARARVRARALGMAYGDLKLERTFTIKAFNQFQDPKPVFNDINIKICTPKAYKMLINMTLDNVAQVGIGGIGALNMSVYYQDKYLGQAISTDPSIGLPRGPTAMVLELTIPKSLKSLPAMTAMLMGIVAKNAQFYAKGNHAYATQAVLLKDAFAKLNMNMPYVDGLKKLSLNPQCDLLSLISGAKSALTG